jgi:hypothetical protein
MTEIGDFMTEIGDFMTEIGDFGFGCTLETTFFFQ